MFFLLHPNSSFSQIQNKEQDIICNSIYSKNGEIHCIYNNILNNVFKSENMNNTYPKTLNQLLLSNKDRMLQHLLKSF